MAKEKLFLDANSHKALPPSMQSLLLGVMRFEDAGPPKPP